MYIEIIPGGVINPLISLPDTPLGRNPIAMTGPPARVISNKIFSDKVCCFFATRLADRVDVAQIIIVEPDRDTSNK